MSKETIFDFNKGRRNPRDPQIDAKTFDLVIAVLGNDCRSGLMNCIEKNTAVQSPIGVSLQAIDQYQNHLNNLDASEREEVVQKLREILLRVG